MNDCGSWRIQDLLPSVAHTLRVAHDETLTAGAGTVRDFRRLSSPRVEELGYEVGDEFRPCKFR